MGEPVEADDASPAGGTDDPPASQGSKVVKLDKPLRVPQRARPRERGERVAGDGGELVLAPGERHPLAAADDDQAKSAGRRGGRRRGGAGYYQSGVRGA